MNITNHFIIHDQPFDCNKRAFSACSEKRGKPAKRKRPSKARAFSKYGGRWRCKRYDGDFIPMPLTGDIVPSPLFRFAAALCSRGASETARSACATMPVSRVGSPTYPHPTLSSIGARGTYSGTTIGTAAGSGVGCGMGVDVGTAVGAWVGMGVCAGAAA